MGGKTFSEGLARRKLEFRSVELVGRSKWRICEDVDVLRNDVHCENGGLCGHPTFFASYRQVRGHSLYWVGLSEVREDRIPFTSGIVRSWIQIG